MIPFKKYVNENPPFFNTSQSIYLSFLMKGSGSDGKTINLENYNDDYSETSPNIEWNIPINAFAGNFIEQPPITGSQWRRFVLAASQSYWRPSGSWCSLEDGVHDVGLLSSNEFASTYPVAVIVQ